jgi:diguanylate cyclase
MSYPTTFELPTTDSLTDLMSVHYFRHLLRETWLPAAKQQDEPLSLLLFDLDGFYALNHSHGRQLGNRVLQATAQTMREVLPETAKLVRYSGDEFGAVLPDTRVDDTFTLAEELRRRIAAISFEEAPDVRFTCSIGLAAFPAHGDNDVELIRAADQALYMAKSTGRNKVSLPPADSRMVTKTSYYTATQLQRLAQLAKTVKRNEATLLREALDDLLKKYNDQLGALAQAEARPGD